MTLAPIVVVDLSVFFVFALAFVFGWNNSGLTTGNLANLISYRASLAITLLGMGTGLVAEGSKMSGLISGKLIPSSQTSLGILLAGSIASLAILFLFTILTFPVSLSNCAVGSFAGAALAAGILLNGGFVAEILVSWTIVPFLSAGIAVAIYELITRVVRNFSLPTLSWFNRLLLLSSVFYISYALGANNMGLIASILAKVDSLSSVSSQSTSGSLLILLDFAIYTAVALGVIIFGKSIAEVVGDKIVGLTQIKTVSAMFSTAFLTWLFTQFSIPLSLTQAVIGGMIGAGAAKGPVILNRNKIGKIIASWILVTGLSALVGFGFAYLLLRFS